MEMSALSLSTGGYIVINEEFDSPVFKDTYKKIFARDENELIKLATGAKI